MFASNRFVCQQLCRFKHQNRTFTHQKWKKMTSLKKQAGLCAIVVGTVGLAEFCRQKYNLTWRFYPNPFLDTECESQHATRSFTPEQYELELRENPIKLRHAVKHATEIINTLKDEFGIPGVAIAVSIDGKLVWKEGFGYSDIENRVAMNANSVFPIASISKTITTAIVARIWEEGKIDLDKEIQHYIPSFPRKEFDGEKVTITPRHLLSHVSGIRHYDKNYTEFLSMKGCSNVMEPLDTFKDDPLVNKPGSKFLYTTYGYTLLSAVVEAAANKPFADLVKDLFNSIGMSNSYLAEHSKIIPFRSNGYVKNKKGEVMNAPYTDISCKLAGGGLQSTVEDLIKFGNAMLYSLQFSPAKCPSLLPGILKPETVKIFWAPAIYVEEPKKENYWYGLGWQIAPEKQIYGFGYREEFYAAHTGGAVGASSVLLIMPRCNERLVNPPNGVVVTIIVNLARVDLLGTARQIATIFKKVDSNPKLKNQKIKCY